MNPESIKRNITKKLKELDKEISKRIDCYFNKEISACYYTVEMDLKNFGVDLKNRSFRCSEYLMELVHEIEKNVSGYFPEMLDLLGSLYRENRIIVNTVPLKTMPKREEMKFLEIPAVFVPYGNEIYVNIPYEICELYETCGDKSTREKIINFFVKFFFSFYKTKINKIFSGMIFHEVVHFFDEKKLKLPRNTDTIFISEVKACALTSSIFDDESNKELSVRTLNILEDLLIEIETNKIDIKYLNPQDQALENIISTYKNYYVPRYGRDDEIERLIEDIEFKLIPLRTRMMQTAKARFYGTYIGYILGTYYLSCFDESTKFRYLREFLFVKNPKELFSLIERIIKTKPSAEVSLKIDKESYEMEIANNKTRRRLIIDIDNVLFS